MEQIRFQYQKFRATGAFQEMHIGFHKTFQCHNPKDLKLIARPRPGSSHLRFHKFKHSFQDSLSPICVCDTVETTVHCLLH